MHKKVEKFKILKTFKGSDFDGTICSHPLLNLGFDYDVPMLDGKFVTLDQGTGIVHCAPSHGVDDFNLCLQHNIPSRYTVDNSGYYTNEIPFFEKTHVFKADPLVIEKLKDEKRLLKEFFKKDKVAIYWKFFSFLFAHSVIACKQITSVIPINKRTNR